MLVKIKRAWHVVSICGRGAVLGRGVGGGCLVGAAPGQAELLRGQAWRHTRVASPPSLHPRGAQLGPVKVVRTMDPSPYARDLSALGRGSTMHSVGLPAWRQSTESPGAALYARCPRCPLNLRAPQTQHPAALACSLNLDHLSKAKKKNQPGVIHSLTGFYLRLFID